MSDFESDASNFETVENSNENSNVDVEDAHIRFQMSQKHKNNAIINGNGFTRQRTNKDLSVYWSCDQKAGKCSASATTNAKNVLVKQNDNHNHDTRMIENEKSACRFEMKRNAVDNSSASTSNVAQNAQSSCKELDHRFGSNRQLKSVVQYSRKKFCDNVAATPTTLDFKYNPNHGNLNGKSIILDDWCGSDSKGERGRITVFGTLELLKQMFAATFWAIDGTFKTRPFYFSTDDYFCKRYRRR